MAAKQFALLSQSFERYNRAANLAPLTLETYEAHLRDFDRFLTRIGHSGVVKAITQEHVERYLTEMRDTRHLAASTVARRFITIRLFFHWLENEHEIKRTPVGTLKSPMAPAQPPTILSDEHLKQLVKACDGRTFDDRRDLAIIRLLIDCGMRRAELASIKLADVDWTENTLRVHGKFRRDRTLHFGAKTAMAIDRYMRSRAVRKLAECPQLFIGQRGALSPDGVYGIVRRRATAAGIPARVFPHLFRHTAAHVWLSDEDGKEGDLMQLMGWKSLAMVSRYGASAAAARARAAHKRMAPGDRI